MTCENCIHYEVCNPAVAAAFGIDTENGALPDGVDAKCIYFREYKSGKWIKRHNERKCSQCKFIYYNSNDDFNFCPNCGAEMFT